MRHTQLRSFHAVAQRRQLHRGGARAGRQPAHHHHPGEVARSRIRRRTVRPARPAHRAHRDAAAACSTSRAACSPTRRRRPTISNETRELKTGHLRVGAVGPYHVTDMLAAFNARYPGLYVSVTVGNSRETLRDLLDYRTDVAVLAHVDPDPRLVAIPYRRHKVVVMCPVGHAFARRRSLRAARHGRPAPDRARGRLDDAPRLRPGDARRRTFGRRS